MNGIITNDVWKKFFEGWMITDCVVRTNTIISLCARKKFTNEELNDLWDHDVPTRLINIFLDRGPENNFGSREFNGFKNPIVGASRIVNSSAQTLLASSNSSGDIWPAGGGQGGPMEFINKNGHPAPRRLKCINGVTYSVGLFRQIYKRKSAGQWQQIKTGFPPVEADTNQGFLDLDAFSEADMYAVGGEGDIWHFDGKDWKQLGFPTNSQLGTVTCAPDGNVYVTGEGGSLWVGRENTWKSVYKGTSTVLWNDAVWFEGKLWLSSDYQLRIWNGKEMVPPESEGRPISYFGHMDAYDGLLIVAGPDFVAGFDGENWKTIITS